WSSWKPWSAGNGEYGENGITQRNRGTETRRETKRFLRDVSVALLLCVCRFLCTLRFRLRTLRLRGARPVRGVLHVADALVLRILRIRAERTRHGRRRVRGGQLGWRNTFLTPVFHRADRVECIPVIVGILKRPDPHRVDHLGRRRAPQRRHRIAERLAGENQLTLAVLEAAVVVLHSLELRPGQTGVRFRAFAQQRGEIEAA